MKTLPAFSVIVAVHNGAATIARAVESVLTQTIPPVELVIIDDGSTDDTAEVISRFGDRVRYHYQPQAGVSAARNQGVSLAEGDWLTFLDADDWYYPNRLRWHAEWIAEEPSLDFLTGDFDYRNPDGHRIRGSMESTDIGRRILDKAKDTDRAVMEGDDLGDFVASHFGDTHTLSLPRRTFLELGGYTVGIRVCEDVQFLIRLCSRSRRIGVVCKPMGVYTIHPNSATRKDPLAAQRETVRALKPLLDKLEDAPRPIRRGLRERVQRARLDLATVLLRNGKRGEAIRAVLPSILEQPGWRSFRLILSVMHGGA
jgi:glycosyltransferase involved in cell wall biosynthesis